MTINGFGSYGLSQFQIYVTVLTVESNCADRTL